MQQPMIDRRIHDAVVETFEGMAFAMPEPWDDGDFDWDAPDLVWASVEAVDPVAGELTLGMSSQLAYRVAEAILGGIEGESQEAVLDALGELMNIVGGQWLMSVAHAGEPIELGLPKSGTGPWSSDSRACEYAVYTIDGERFGIALRREAGNL